MLEILRCLWNTELVFNYRKAKGAENLWLPRIPMQIEQTRGQRKRLKWQVCKIKANYNSPSQRFSIHLLVGWFLSSWWIFCLNAEVIIACKGLRNFNLAIGVCLSFHTYHGDSVSAVSDVGTASVSSILRHSYGGNDPYVTLTLRINIIRPFQLFSLKWLRVKMELSTLSLFTILTYIVWKKQS